MGHLDMQLHPVPCAACPKPWHCVVSLTPSPDLPRASPWPLRPAPAPWGTAASALPASCSQACAQAGTLEPRFKWFGSWTERAQGLTGGVEQVGGGRPCRRGHGSSVASAHLKSFTKALQQCASSIAMRLRLPACEGCVCVGGGGRGSRHTGGGGGARVASTPLPGGGSGPPPGAPSPAWP